MKKNIYLAILAISLSFLLTGCYETLLPPQIVDTKPSTSSYPNDIKPQKHCSYTRVKKRNHSLVGKTIIVDPGHGGKDPGALAKIGGRNEKDLVLDIAKRLAKKLGNKGARVIMTRKTDRFVKLDNRAKLADKYNANILISIHIDSHRNPRINGATCYIARKSLRKSREVAESICCCLESNLIRCKGVRKADFRVLVGHSKPAVLIECGYITNSIDDMNLNNGSYRDKIAQSIATAIEQSL